MTTERAITKMPFYSLGEGMFNFIDINYDLIRAFVILAIIAVIQMTIMGFN